jgi:hypothetical protein
VGDTPLGGRGWVVQERILSPRVVHFSSNQLFWDCCQEKAAELLPTVVVGDDGELKKVAPYPDSSEAEDTSKAWIYTNWNRLIKIYGLRFDI